MSTPSSPDTGPASEAPSRPDGEETAPGERPPPRPRRHRWGWLLLLAGLVVLGIVIARRLEHPRSPGTTGAGGAGAQGRGARGPQSVVTARASTRDVPVFITGLGSVTPTSTVTVHTRVDGQLMRIAIEEGQSVNAGDLLAELDPRPFLSQLEQVQGQLARDEALLQNARIDLRRYTALIEQDSVARQTLDTQRALVRQYEGIVKADKGAVAAAELNLIYTRITAPIAGRTGLRLVDAGNIIHASDVTGLVVITPLQPIDVIFSVPEDHLPEILAKLAGRQPLEVQAFDRARQRLLDTGTLSTTDNLVDPATGTIRLKASFPNRQRQLFPQQFVNARLRLDILRDATLVPTAALQHGVQGTFVYVVQKNDTVAVRTVTTGPADGDDTVIRQGLNPGEQVVVEGADQLTNGAPIRLHEASHRPPGPGVGGSGPGTPDGGR